VIRCTVYLWLAIVVAAGCGRIGFDPSQADGFPQSPVVLGSTSGSRLHAERWVTADGVAQFAGWYDTQLAISCDWISADVWRCMPHLQANAFADPACTKPAVRGPLGCEPPRFATRFGAVPTGFTVTGPVTAAYSNTFGTCVPVTDEAIYYALGPQVPDDTFIAGAAVTTPFGDGLTTTEIVGADNSRQFHELGYAGRACDIVPSETSSTVCLSRDATEVDEVAPEYRDSACSIEVIEDVSGPPYSSVTYVSQPCRVRPVAVGASQPGGTVYLRDTTGACVPRATPASAFLPVIDASQVLPPLVAVDVATGARLRASAWRLPGGTLAFREFYDTMLQVPCTPLESFASGRAYCVPGGGAGVPSSASPNCATSATNVVISCGGPEVEIAGTGSQGCAGINVTFATQTTRIAPPLSYDAGGGVCVPIDTTGKEIWALGTQVPYDPSGLAELTLVHD
jgi:hypothetical protein